MIRFKELEVTLSSKDHDNIFVIIEVPENATKEQILEIAISKAFQNTYIWNIKGE